MERGSRGEEEENYRAIYERQLAEEREYEDLIRRVDRLRRERRERQASAEKELRWAKFKVWTLYACSYMDGVHQGDPEWGRPDLIAARAERLRSYLRGGLVVLSRTEIDEGLRRNDLIRAGSLGRCHAWMVELLRDLPGPVDQDWLMDRVEYERRGGRAGEIISGVIESLRKAAADGTAVLVRAASAPYAGDRRTGEDSRGRDHGSSMPDIDKLPWRQLRGISAHGW